MAKIYHHTDDDGLCAAYIVKDHIIAGTELLTPTDFIRYNYNSDLTKTYEDIKEGERIYIVDLSMCPAIEDLIYHCLIKGCTVIHIDHHKTGIDYLEQHAVNSDKYIHFMRNGISGTMLTWIYANVFSEAGQKHPMDVPFDFDNDEQRTRCCLIDEEGNPRNKDGRKILIEGDILQVPDVVRFIDDNDIWKQKIPETLAFCWGFRLCENKHPLSQIWVELFDTSRHQSDILKGIINDGETVLKYRRATDLKNLSAGFFAVVDTTKVVFLNTPEGNSMIFDDVYNEVEAVCKYSFDGTKYWYTFYSKDDGADVSLLVKFLEKEFGESCGFLSGGGHVHAAGVTFTKNFLDHLEILKDEFIEMRKNIRIERELAAEQKRLDEERRKFEEQQRKLDAMKAKLAAREAETEDYGF